MGIGDALGSVFGGGNDFKFSMPPTLGAPRQPGESDQDYANRIYQNYQSQNQDLQGSINQAMRATPGDPLNFRLSNETLGKQNALDQALQGRTNADINFGTQGSMGQQQGLIDQILAQGRGEGPNPALDQLRMTTDQNAKQAAAMAASQKGTNPGLAARLASQSVANVNQQAVGQAGLQSAQQQLAAQQLGGGLLGQQIGQQTQQAGMSANLQQAYANLLAQQLGQQRGQDITQATNQGQAGLQLMGQRANLESIRRQAQLGNQQNVNNIFNSMNATNAGVSAQNASQNFQYGMGAASGLASALQGAASMSKGGEVPNPFMENVKKKNMKKMAFGGVSDGGMGAYLNYQQSPMAAYEGVLSQAGQAAAKSGAEFQKSTESAPTKLMDTLHSLFNKATPQQSMGGPSLGVDTSLGVPGTSNYNQKFGLLDTSQRMGGTTLDPMASLGVPQMSFGGKIDGKAKTKGDSETNDVVPAMLSPGEIVIPRSATGSSAEAHAFLDQIMTKHEGPDYKSVMKAREKFHKMAHGGEMSSCNYCYGGMT